MINIYSEKTATTLKANTIAAYSVHVRVSNFFEAFQKYSIDLIRTLLELLPVSTLDVKHNDEELNKTGDMT